MFPETIAIIKENTAVGTVIDSFRIDDPDQYQKFTSLDFWGLGGPGPDSTFIHETFELFFNSDSSRVFTRIKQTMDIDTMSSALELFTINLSIKDNSVSPLGYSSGSKGLYISDANDINPTVTSGQNFSVNENAAIGDTIGVLAATDGDIGVDTFSLWTIHSGNINNWYTVLDSGVLTVANSLDYENRTKDTLDINVYDTLLFSPLEEVYITINDINEAPVVTSGQSFTIAEDLVGGSVIGNVTATDQDAGATLSNWIITSGNTGNAFSINSISGILITTSGFVLDRETTPTYTLGIQVSDGTLNSSVETITINISDINDTPPVVTAGQVFTLNEGNVTNASVGSVAVTDADAPPTTLSAFTIVSGNTGSIFSINSTTGAITATGNLDFETTPTYTLGITVSDGTNTSAIQTITVDLNNTNDSDPVVTASQTFPVNENQSVGTTVGTVVATDPDTSSPSFSNWTITSGNTGGAFSINPTNGVITTNVSLDYETTSTYTLGITVSDGTNTSAAQNVTINVVNILDELTPSDYPRTKLLHR